ncbi:lysosomal cystine transporter [Geopyxis carbonaria]|nr:lysosomal cystine transporter [Geopyxis carbonaria]
MYLQPPTIPSESEAFARAVSRLLGWAYVAAWGISFYPQLFINMRRKAVTGLALDYFTLNILGFACYTISSIAFLYSPVVREQYARRHPLTPEPTVRWNDLAFAAHALVLSLITWTQFYFWGYQRHPQQRLSVLMKAIIVGCIAAIVVSVFLTDGETWEWIDVVYTLQFVKLFISVVKYTPQAYLNYQRKSTIGWSIENILLDFSGGVLSLGQLIIDSSLQSDWSGLTGNPVKFFLSQIAIMFDIVFILQHHVLYRRRVVSDEHQGFETDYDTLDDSGDAEAEFQQGSLAKIFGETTTGTAPPEERAVGI